MSRRGFDDSCVTGRSWATARDRSHTWRAPAVAVLALAALVAGGSVGSAGAGKASRVAAASPSGGWSAPVRLFGGQGSRLPAISCVSALLCVAAGARGSSGVGLSGATVWSSPAVIDAGGGLAAVSCAPGGACVAVGASELLGLRGVTDRFRKGRWSAGPTSEFDLAAVSCPTARFCAAVDDLVPHGHGFIFNGTRWSSPISIGVSATSISCPTTTFCAAVSQSGEVLYYQDRTWSKATSIDASGALVSVSCASTTFCVAVDGDGNALTDVNGQWSKPIGIDPSAGLASVSCPTTTFSMAVNTSGGALSYSGSQWSFSQTIFGGIPFTSVSCPTANFCAAVGQNATMTAVYATTYRSPP